MGYTHRIDRLESEVTRLHRQVTQLERRVSRLESGGHMPGHHGHHMRQWFE